LWRNNGGSGGGGQSDGGVIFKAENTLKSTCWSLISLSISYLVRKQTFQLTQSVIIIIK
jgi:hypothetical protein